LDDEILVKRRREVDIVDEKIRQILDDMGETMYNEESFPLFIYPLD